MVSSGDDENYFAESTAIAYLQFPHFGHEYLQDQYANQRMPYTSLGPGILASPFVFVGSLVDRYENASISKQRTASNIFWSWSILGFQIASFFYLLLGALLLYLTLINWVSEKVAQSVTLASIFGGGGLLLYVAVRPIMSHAYEFFGISLVLYLYFKHWKRNQSTRNGILLSLSLSLLTLVRYNLSIFCIAVLSILIRDVIKTVGVSGRKKIKAIAFLTAPGLFLFVFWRILPIAINGYSSADITSRGIVPSLLETIPINELFNRISYIVFNPGMGVLFTGTYVLFGIYTFTSTMISREFKSPFSLCIILAIFVNGFIIVNWDGFGGFYGYRYLVISASPLLSIGFAIWTGKIRSPIRQKAVYIGSTFLPVLSMLYWYSDVKYKANVFTRTDGSQYIDVSHSYNLNTVRDFFTNPISIFQYHLNNGVLGAFQRKNFSFLNEHQFTYSVAREILYLIVSGLFIFTALKIGKTSVEGH